MKTKHNSPTRSKSARHNGKAGNDTNPGCQYEVELHWTQHNRATVTIQAKSLEAARQKANRIRSDEVDDWDPFDGEMDVDSVRLVEGGQDND